MDDIHVPEGLFARIMGRLGLEKELRLVRNNLGFFGGLAVIFLVLSGFAFIGVRQVWQESSVGPLLALAFSDPSIVVRYWHSFVLSVIESVPGISAALLLFAVATCLLFGRMLAGTIERFGVLKNTLHISSHEHH